MCADLRFALRSLAQSPGFTAVTVLTLALGIGLSTTIFNGVNPLLFRALPFHEPASLVYLSERNEAKAVRRMGVAYADFVHWQRENRVFASLGVSHPASVNLGGGDQPERIEACYVSAALLPTLGLAPALGRSFAAEEDQPGAPAVVLLGDALWQRRFGGDPAVIGRTIQLNQTAHTVIGVMPPGVRFPYDSDAWVPMVVAEPEKTHASFSNRAVARLRPGVSRAQAQADLDAIHARIAAESPTTNAQVTALVEPIEEGFLDRDLRAMGWTMLGAVVFVLAVACANVASLFLTRALARHQEFAIRTALGAGRWRLLRQLLVESLVLGTIAGGLGLLLAVWGLDLVLRLVPIEIPYWIDFSFDGRVLGVAVGVSLLTSLLFGLVPAWQASRLDVQSGLSVSARGSSGNRQRQRLRSLFVISEVALATLLLCGTGLMIRSLLNLQRVDPGFDPARLTLFYLNLNPSAPATASARTSFFTTLTQRLESLPGVASAAICSSPPLSGRSNGQGFVIEGRPAPSPSLDPVGNLRVVSPGYFDTMKIPLLAGRDFAGSDSASSAKVIIIDAAFARKYFDGESPLGQRLRWTLDRPGDAMEIIGVVADVKHSSLTREPSPGFYVPYAQSARRNMAVILRTTTDESLSVIGGARQALRELDPTLALYRPTTARQMIGETYWINRFLGKLLVGFAVMALALAAVGIAGVVAYAVAQRTRELGVRIALGAQRRDVLQLIVGQGLRLVLLGLALGLLASLGLTQALGSQLYAIGWLDPATIAVSASVFLLVALVACWLPARRALRINPIDALRAE